MHISFGPADYLRRSRLTLYVANRDRAGNHIPNIQRWVDRARHLFARLFGGCTAIPAAKGLWYSKVQGLCIEEETAIITSYVNTDDVITHLDTLRTFLQEILVGTDQEALAVDLDGDLYLVHVIDAPAVCTQPRRMTQ
jgi:hypothetical protein